MDQGLLILGDAHVHLYPQFEISGLLHSACQNFKKIAERQSPGGPWAGFLFLAETEGEKAFGSLSRAAEGQDRHDSTSEGKWRFHKTKESDSLYGQEGPGDELFIIAGRQIRTAENLEVLALGTRTLIREGLPLIESIRLIQAAGALPVIPWGFGKWWGARGRAVEKALQHPEGSGVFLGDSLHRPALYPRSSLFSQASRRGIKILPGSDPLPLPGQDRVPDSYGFWLRGDLDRDYPLRSIKTLLLDSGVSPQPFGGREGLGSFLRNQILLRIGKGR
jgi:hypothetical protein